MEQSSAGKTIPMPISFIEHVTRLMHIAVKVASRVGYPHTGIMQFLQTLAGVMVIDGRCFPVLAPFPGLELLVDLPPGC